MLARKIAFNTIISAAARIFGTVLALVTIGLITRYLTKGEWGEYSIVLTFGSIFSVLAEGGLYQLMVREISKDDVDEREIASNIFTIRLLFGLFIFAAGVLLGFLFPYSAQAHWGILVGMIGFWFFSSAQVSMGIFQKYLKMEKVALAELAGRAAQLILIFLFIHWQMSFLWIVASLTFSGLVNFLVIYWLAQSHITMRLHFSKDAWKKIIKQGYPLAISGILTMIYFSFDSLLLSIFKPVEDVGIYRLSYKILESLIFFPAMFVGLVMPILSRTAFNNWPQFEKILRRSQEVLFIFALPLVLGTFALSPQIINLLGGQNYPESIGVLNILIVAVGIIFFGTLFSYTLIALEKQKVLLWISVAGAVFNVIFNLIFIPRYSFLAAAIITVLTELLVTILMVAVIGRLGHFPLVIKTGLKSLAAALCMAIILWQWQNLNLFILLALAGLIYFSILYLLRGFSAKDFLSLARKEA